MSFFNYRFGYTPLEEARAMSNDKIIKVIETFQKEHSPEVGPPEEEPELEATVVQLSERVQYLESLLTEVSRIGGALKNTTSNGGDPNVLELAEKLAAIKAEEEEGY